MTLGELQQWVGDTQHFMSAFWRTRPAVFDTGPSAPMDLGDVDTALASGLLRTPHVEMVRAEQKIDQDSYTSPREVEFQRYPGFADSEAVTGLLREGATLLLRNTEQWHRPTAQLVSRFAAELGRRIEAFYFITPPGAQGLPLHRDDADVFLLQIAGSKEWTVRSGPATPNWGPGSVIEEPGPVLLHTTVTEGQVLYIPNGYAHSAVTAKDLSVHLSLTVREIGSSHLTRALPRLLLEGVRLQARPRDEDGLLESASLLLDTVRARLATVLPQDLVRFAREAQSRQMTNDGEPASIARFVEELVDAGEAPKAR
ncbi:JmjC domain-containing protein [Streptomyces sp. NPDC086010]|uniref:JmjC domain-containing protein n=1 Tax=Streptomyces sp. NPDC086010 TaxID=3365745 RepID=UPI0037D7AE7C